MTCEEWDRLPALDARPWEEHIVAVKLARQFDIPWIRPMAIYCCLEQPVERVSYALRDPQVSEEDTQVLVRGLQYYTSLQLLRGFGLLHLQCRCKCWKKAMDAIYGGLIPDPLGISSDWELGPCDSCGKNRMERSRTWYQIPTGFGLSWEELKRSKGD